MAKRIPLSLSCDWINRNEFGWYTIREEDIPKEFVIRMMVTKFGILINQAKQRGDRHCSFDNDLKFYIGPKNSIRKIGPIIFYPPFVKPHDEEMYSRSICYPLKDYKEEVKELIKSYGYTFKDSVTIDGVTEMTESICW